MLDTQKHASDLQELNQNLQIYKESIREISDEILANDVSKYPIFVAYREEVNLGKLIIDKEELALEWSINASTLEEFAKRNIIKQDKLKAFIQTYKDPAKFVCVFAVMKDNAGFIYLPYDEEE
jgi:predicted transport protein